MIVRIEHLRAVPGFGPKPGFCARGGRQWFARHQLDWAAFVRQGIDASLLEATGDPLALALVEHARKQEGGANGQQ
ncbi:hypothetical protein B9Y88_03030 [Stenotrophomonas maltophilia]|uniref:hypothetical protein n=1 Tax=Stenotrophomonas muris TaxID=2963283 RepID=UPI000C2690E2|nr:hypothetical protein B9Y88_03030 [Stenotrophomonas maltophilia]